MRISPRRRPPSRTSNLDVLPAYLLFIGHAVIFFTFCKTIRGIAMKISNCLLQLGMLLALAGCATAPGSTQAPIINPDAQAVAVYHIGVDDQLQVSVWHNPDLSVSVPVRPDGKITVPLIGDVEAGGRTPEQVAGAVRAPISIPNRPGMTVLDAVLAAGGTTEFAAPDHTELYRKTGTSTQAYAVRLDNILQKGELKTNYPVQPGDVITVPQRAF